MPISFVDLAVRDLARSTAFYTEFLDLNPLPQSPAGTAWLAAGPAVLRLHEVHGAARTADWRPDNQQRGFRHVGFKVGDLDDGLVAAEHARPVPAAPRFDHVAVTVADRDAAVERYRDRLGLIAAGRLRYPDLPGGFEITYLHGGPTVLEVFSWSTPTEPAAVAEPDLPGFQAIGVTPPGPADTGVWPPDADGLRVHVAAPAG